MCATAPHSQGASSLPPASRSCAIEARISAGRVCANAEAAVDVVIRDRHAARPGEAPGFAHRLLEQPAQLGIRAHHAQGRTRHGGRAAHADKKDELLPDHAHDIVGQLGIDARPLAGGEKGLGRGALRGSQCAELQPRHRADVLDHAGRRDARGDVGGASHDAFFRKYFFQTLHRVDPVLEWDHDGVGCDDRAQALGRAFGVPKLYREQHHVHRGRLRRVLEHLHPQLRGAERALEREPALLQRGEMPAAGEERYVVAGLLQPCAEVAAHAARAHGGNAHLNSL